MARRYGAEHSPDAPEMAKGRYRGATVDPAGARTNLLFLPPVLLLLTSITSGALGLVAGLAGAGALALAAWLLREGLRAEAAYNARRIARRSLLPRKMLASVLTGVGTALAAWKTEPGLVAPLLYGVAAAALHVGAFGIDPLRNKGVSGVDSFQQTRVARAVEEAEKHLGAMAEAATRSGDREVEARVDRFRARVREMLRTVENDPRDLTGARKYMSVYLLGARDATIKFADLYAHGRDAGARRDYLVLLTDLEEEFGAKTERLLQDDRSDLDVEIEVLRDRLNREGVRVEQG
ncbi:hypothetical protein E0K89_009000 [Aquicoccus sp. SCR17]|nr:hypothetical protein [Carideicomes alvinocaridis]